MTKEIEITQNKLAVLIDADNASPKIIKGLFDEIAKYGIASVKRIYGDWSTANLSGWKKCSLEHAINPVQQFSYTTGKNSTDSILIIDAMDILYTNKLNGFCIVSSDSDFTRLCLRLRESGMIVYGFGEKKTPSSFVRACDKYIYTEILIKDEKNDLNSPKPMENIQSDKKLIALLVGAVEDSGDEHGWSNLGLVGKNITNKNPEFDSRTYGHKKLSDLMEATGIFEMKDSNKTYIKLKK